MRRVIWFLFNSGLFTLTIWIVINGVSFYLQYLETQRPVVIESSSTMIMATLDGKQVFDLEIEVDGKVVGYTPYEANFLPGPHRVTVFADDAAIAEAAMEFKLDGLPPKLIKAEFTLVR